MIRVGILTLSDRASKGEYKDISGNAIKEILQEWITNEIEFFYEVIPYDFELIKSNLIKFCDELNCDLIFTTGGTVSFKVGKEDRRYVSIIPAEATEA